VYQPPVEKTVAAKLALKGSYIGIGIILAIAGLSLVGLRIGTLSAPGPGQWPMALIIMGLVLTAVLFFTDRTPVELGTTSQWTRLAIAAGSMFVFIPLYYYLGFVVAAAILGFIYLCVLGGEKWWVSLLGAAANAVAIYAVFAWLLSVPV
jgi:putative tricarboxylic transport membrane protein